MKSIVIAGYARSPFHLARKGALAGVRPDDLAAEVVKALVARTGIDPNTIEDGVGHGVEAHHRHARHALDAGTDEGFARVHLDGASGTVDRLHGRAAKAVQGCASDRDRQASHQADKAGNIEALLAFGERAAH